MNVRTRIVGWFILTCVLVVFIGGFSALSYAGSYSLTTGTQLIQTITSAPNGKAYNFGRFLLEFGANLTPAGAVSDAVNLVKSFVSDGLLDYSQCTTTLSKLVHVFDIVLNPDFSKTSWNSLNVNIFNSLIANPNNTFMLAPTIYYSVNELPTSENRAAISGNLRSNVMFTVGDVVYLYAGGFSDQVIYANIGSRTLRVKLDINQPVSFTVLEDMKITFYNEWFDTDFDTYTVSFINSGNFPVYYLLDYYAFGYDEVSTYYTVSSGYSSVVHTAAFYYFYTTGPNLVDLSVYDPNTGTQILIPLSAVPYKLAVDRNMTISFVSH